MTDDSPEKEPAGKPQESATAPPKPATPVKPAAPPKAAAAVPKPVPLDNELVQRLRARFGEAIRDSTLDRNQAIVLIEVAQLREICRYCRDEEKFDMLTDLTAVDWPKREKRFDLVLILYSFAKNERLRLKAHAARRTSVCPACARVWADGELAGARSVTTCSGSSSKAIPI